MKEGNQLYVVHTRKWIQYLVIATGWDEAHRKASEAIAEDDDQSVLNAEGDLNKDLELDEITSIEIAKYIE